MKTNALQKRLNSIPQILPQWKPSSGHNTETFPPQRVATMAQTDETSTLQMYTEDEVAAMLRVSLSQLRKWRTRQNRGKLHGPPFKKMGRLVRYPGRALQAYINGD